MKEEKVEFLVDEKKIVGILHIPDIENPPAIIMVHGLSVNKDEGGIFTRCAQKLCESGFKILRFDFPNGMGESGGSMEEMNIETEKLVLRSVIDFILKQKIDKNNIGILAASFGAVSTILLNDQRIKCICFWNPSRGNFKPFLDKCAEPNYIEKLDIQEFIRVKREIRDRDFKLRSAFIKKMSKFNLANFISNIRKSIIIIHGTEDEFVPIDKTKEMFEKANEPKEFETIQGAKHGFHDIESEKKAIQITLDWFNKHLK